MTKKFQSQSLNDWLFYLEQQHPSEIELGLARVKQTAEQADIKEFANSKVVLVAGTNGKGTTIRFIESYLLAQGKTVGVYSSPHLFKYNERVRINGQDASDQQHIDSLSYIEEKRQDIPLTYFEFGTLAGLRLLQQSNLDYVLIEVGLGGRLDATNIIKHDVAVITSIGLDHVDWLGDTLEKIAFEKAGIIRENKPVVIGEPVQYQSFQEQARALKASDVFQVEQDFSFSQSEELWSVKLGERQFNNLALPLIPIQNVSTALKVLDILNIDLSEAEINDVLANVSLPGRMQMVADKPMQMVDVAHNSHALKYLLNTIDNHPCFKQVKSLDIVIAMMKDKDISESLELFKGKVNNWYVAELKDNPRAAKAKDLANTLRKLGEESVHELSTIDEAWNKASENQSGESLLLGLGSFYTVAEILERTEVQGDRNH